MTWIRNLGRKLSGVEARERREEEQRKAAEAEQILAEHEARDHFGADEALRRLQEVMGDEPGLSRYVAHVSDKIGAVVGAALADSVLTPEEEASIERVRHRYGGPKIDADSSKLMDAARALYTAASAPLVPVQVPLMLKKGEWCAHAVRATAHEQRQRTVRVNYGGTTARVRIVKGVYYNVGSINVDRVSEGYLHSFGEGVLGATNTRLLWVSPEKSISIPLGKIVMFEPYTDGVKIIKDTGKPLIFEFDGPDRASMVRITRAIEELRA